MEDQSKSVWHYEEYSPEIVEREKAAYTPYEMIERLSTVPYGVRRRYVFHNTKDDKYLAVERDSRYILPIQILVQEFDDLEEAKRPGETLTAPTKRRASQLNETHLRLFGEGLDLRRIDLANLELVAMHHRYI